MRENHLPLDAVTFQFGIVRDARMHPDARDAPGPEPQLEDSYTGRLLTSRRDTIAYGTIPCIDLRKEDLDGPSSLVRMCVKID